MVDTSARLLRLLALLQARRFWSGRELAEALQITDRTLRRDVDRLRTLGYPVDSSTGVAGGYSLGVGAALPPLMLDDDEALAITLSLQASTSAGLVGIEEGAVRALGKIEQVLPAKIAKRLAALKSSIVRLPRSWGSGAELEAVSALAAACAERTAISFGYRDHGGHESRRAVEPHRVVHLDRRWYLVAWDEDRSDWRTFRIDRMRLPIERRSAFAPRMPPDDDVGAFVSRAVSIAPYRIEATLIFHAPVEALRPRIPAGSGVLESVDATRCRFRTGANSVDMLATWLGCLGVDFEVEEGAELAARLRDVAERLDRASGGCAPSASRRSPAKGIRNRASGGGTG